VHAQRLLRQANLASDIEFGSCKSSGLPQDRTRNCKKSNRSLTGRPQIPEIGLMFSETAIFALRQKRPYAQAPCSSARISGSIRPSQFLGQT
jgi:hypothetical protein